MEHIAITAIGTDNPAVLNDLVLLATKNECLIQETRMTMMGNTQAVIMLVSGNWNTIAKMETALKSYDNQAALVYKRTKPTSLTQTVLPYLVQIIAVNRPGILHEITSFFVSQNCLVDDLQSSTYIANLSAVEMISITQRIGIDSSTNITDFREQFALLCDELNIDGGMEPEKP